MPVSDVVRLSMADLLPQALLIPTIGRRAHCAEITPEAQLSRAGTLSFLVMWRFTFAHMRLAISSHPRSGRRSLSNRFYFRSVDDQPLSSSRARIGLETTPSAD